VTPSSGPGWPHQPPDWPRPPGSQQPAGSEWPQQPPDWTRRQRPPGYGWSPQPPPERPPGRRVGWLASIVILLLVVGLAGGGLLLATRREPAPDPAVSASPSSTATRRSTTPATRAPATSPANSAAVRTVQRQVAELRDLRFTRRVPVTIEAPAELASRLRREVAAETDETELARQGRALELLGELPAGTDLPRLLDDLRDESVLGFYLPGRPPKGGLYVRSARGLDPFAKSTLAHELTHALTDQHFDLTRIDRLAKTSGREDEVVAYSALAEGDATLTAQGYFAEHLTRAEQLDAARVAAGTLLPRRTAAPLVIREGLQFPYREGPRFVARLYARGGWAAVNRAYRDPPTSTEQILHPERYLGARDRPQTVPVPDVSRRLGAGWRSGAQLGFGEFDARLLLQGELPVTAAQAAAAGWDGGRLRTFQQGGRTAMALRTVWDSAAEAEQFCGAMTRWAGTRFGHGARAGGGTVRWSGGGQRTALACRGTRVAWLSAPDRPTLDRLLAALGGP
jgi:hypothetical protein